MGTFSTVQWNLDIPWFVNGFLWKRNMITTFVDFLKKWKNFEKFCRNFCMVPGESKYLIFCYFFDFQVEFSAPLEISGRKFRSAGQIPPFCLQIQKILAPTTLPGKTDKLKVWLRFCLFFENVSGDRNFCRKAQKFRSPPKFRGSWNFFIKNPPKATNVVFQHLVLVFSARFLGPFLLILGSRDRNFCR